MADIKRDKSEVLHYDNSDFKVYARKNHIPAFCCFDDMEIHWHDELEFIYVLSGKIRYWVDGKIVSMKAGEGIFVNTRHFHLIKNEEVDCVLICVIFASSLLSADVHIAKEYVEPILFSKELGYILLSNEVPWQAEVLSCVKDIYEKSRQRIQ